MHSPLSRRSVLAAIVASVRALALTKNAHALTTLSATDARFPTAKGAWAILEHATDGSDPSTALEIPPAPHFTAAIKELAGAEVALSGYLTALAPAGFGKKPDYLLSREPFHCPYCYGFGRGSLALVTFEGHMPALSSKVTITGILAMQDKDPSDFYFQLNNAKIV